MGASLATPVTEKQSSEGWNDKLTFGSCSMQGWRPTMEDAHVHLLETELDKDVAFFAVFDGHGGAGTAQRAAVHVHKAIINSDAYKSGDIAEAMRLGFLVFDEDMRSDPDMKGDNSGCTAVCCLVSGSKIYCANAGDSRAVLSVAGEAVPLSFDHKPYNKDEHARIDRGGGFVIMNRVNGSLALSRALGDFQFKVARHLSAEEQIVTANPEIIEKAITPETEFIIIACDGIWDVMSNEEAVAFVRERVAKGDALQQICEQMVDYCLAPSASTEAGMDNMTVVIVGFTQGDYASLVSRCLRTYTH